MANTGEVLGAAAGAMMQMADFDIAYPIIKAWEGNNVYAILKNDDGGETFAGISRVYVPQWEGWKEVDAFKNTVANGLIRNGTKIPKAAALVPEFYRKEIWEKKGKCHLIRNQQLANLVFDACVQHGRAARIINQAVKDCGMKMKMTKSRGKIVPVNTIYSDTLNCLNSIPKIVYPLIWEGRHQYYQSDSDWLTFKKGWMNRLNSFPKII